MSQFDGFTTVEVGASGSGPSIPWHDEPGDGRRKIGRYPILRRLGAGGMGVVYAAYDEVLGRRLAIKVLHPHVWDDGRRSERLLREAKAMACINHPNVITVHEVGTADGQLFVVMEFVAGPTLEGWLTMQKRTWPQIVAVFRQVAEGVAAIHAAGLVHRDIKPSNVLIGDDGRVRVLDLGLVTVGIDEAIGNQDIALRSSPSLTMTGERVGTPAYMSREQFLGLEPTPASDIFSFSIALYEALYGVHPFLAASFLELQMNVEDGRIRPPPNSNGVPAWLHGLVVRGLAPEPRERPVSMRAMSSELAKDPSRTRRRWIASVASVALAASVGMLATVASAPASGPQCDGGEAAIAGVWTSEHAADIRAAMLATGQPYAPALAERITEALDDYADDWAAAHNRICGEHARGERSDALLDARMACLDHHRQAFAQTLEILADADAEVIDHAGDLVAKLPRIGACDELTRTTDHQGPPASLAVAPLVGDLESRLVRAETLANAGRIAESTAVASEVAVEAEALDQPRIVVDALLAQARASILHFDRSATGVLLGRAQQIAIAHGLDVPAAEAMIRRLYVRGLASGGSEFALADVPIAEAMLVRAGDDPELRALLLNNVGAIHAAAGDRESAREAFEQALALEQRLFGDRHLELAVGLANLGMLTPDSAARSALHQRMIDIYERRLGPEHPRTLDARLLAAFHTEDPELAVAALARLCPRFRAIGELRFAGECELERGRIEFARGRFDVARAAFELAHEQLGQQDTRRVLLDGYLRVGTDFDVDAEIVGLRELIATVDAHGEGEGWWVRLEQAERRSVLGRLLLQAGTPTAAVVELERAIVDLDAIADQAQPIERDRLLAGARATLDLARAESESESQSNEATKRAPP